MGQGTKTADGTVVLPDDEGTDVLVEWNLRLAWSLDKILPDEHRVTLEAQAFNLLNWRAITNPEERVGASFGSALEQQPPLRLSFGVSYKY